MHEYRIQASIARSTAGTQEHDMVAMHELDPVSTTSYASEALLICRALSPFVRACLLKEEALGLGTKKKDLDCKSTSSFSSSDDDYDSSSSSEEDAEQL